MPYTENGHKAGRIEYEATVRWMTRLDDPEALGNMGVSGADDNWEAGDFANIGTALNWIERKGRDLVRDERNFGFYAEIRRGEWVREEYDDNAYGHVVDAQWQPRRVWRYTMHDGPWTLYSEEEDES